MTAIMKLLSVSMMLMLEASMHHLLSSRQAMRRDHQKGRFSAGSNWQRDSS
jgi:hypothetical protein